MARVSPTYLQNGKEIGSVTAALPILAILLNVNCRLPLYLKTQRPQAANCASGTLCTPRDVSLQLALLGCK
jgi:hypothetical protein